MERVKGHLRKLGTGEGFGAREEGAAITLVGEVQDWLAAGAFESEEEG